MSSVTKRPAEESITTNSKRAKTDLPAGFFDSDKSKPASVASNDDDDDEWARFQAELGDSTTAKTNETKPVTKSRLDLLGLGAGEGTIVADAVLTNPLNTEAAVQEQKGNRSSSNDRSTPEEANTTRSKKAEMDALIEEEAAEGLLAEFDVQKELHERLMKMKGLQTRAKQKLQSIRNDEIYKIDDNQPKYEQLNGDKVDVVHPSSTNGGDDIDDDDDDDDEDDDDNLWRKRTL
ncbi:hypothetical protein D0Z00_001008 [Geotrichum galactomycetum]|uniref:Uncharacterized protein n=1 Tax=Geotrichum galactomycetum TaxID=27317 RepID=A0ACB6V8A0_9ASCO|nr:hypothetical protein D0Z00_001008 [Geotrichum candidum]